MSVQDQPMEVNYAEDVDTTVLNQLSDPMELVELLEQPNKRFQCNAKALHLTYKTHIPLQELLLFLQAQLGQMEWYSMVQEMGHGSVTTYPHTHVAFEMVQKAVFTAQRKLDYAGVHPHIKVMKGKAQMISTWRYHQKEPVALLQSEKSPLVVVNIWQEILDAPSLVEACKIAGMEIKSISDVVALRADRSVRQVIPPILNACCWRMMLTAPFRTVYLHGPTGVGKTQWALAQFEQPLLVSHMSDLKLFTVGLHDGIVFDDISLSCLPSTAVIHLVDWDLPRTMNVKYGSVSIPAKTRKIITSNMSPQEAFKFFPVEHMPAIMRRLYVLHEEIPLFIHRRVISSSMFTDRDQVLPISSSDTYDPEAYDVAESLLDFAACVDDI